MAHPQPSETAGAEGVEQVLVIGDGSPMARAVDEDIGRLGTLVGRDGSLVGRRFAAPGAARPTLAWSDPAGLLVHPDLLPRPCGCVVCIVDFLTVPVRAFEHLLALLDDSLQVAVFVLRADAADPAPLRNLCECVVGEGGYVVACAVGPPPVVVWALHVRGLRLASPGELLAPERPPFVGRWP